MISIGGEFRSVNNGRFEGLVRFSYQPRPAARRTALGCRGANWTGTAQSFIPGRARISIPANWDRDDLTLTYELRRPAPLPRWPPPPPAAPGGTAPR
ncbi:hypothetical protein AB1285_17475 [Microbacterium sp. NRRL B-14842]|uniref:hypothetical protein n=1 Tax=Microbacterium sp. NRRL B-14842 TaxID=3162881 RepID=UPI003D2CF99D